MANGREQYLQALASLTDLTRTQAERVAGLLAKQGEVQSAQVGRVAEDLMRRTQKNREILSRLVQREVKRQLGMFGMATREEVARLQQRVRALEQAVERSSKPTPAATASRTTRSSTRSTRSAARGSGSAKPSTRSTSASTRPSTRSSSAAAKPSTRTRTGGASSRSTPSSPRTRRATGARGSGPGDEKPT